jgi:magnesium chelatase family protein
LRTAHCENSHKYDYFGDPLKECSRSMGMVYHCQLCISGLLLGRIDIHLDGPRVSCKDLAGLEKGETSATIRERVERARRVQKERFAPHRRATLPVNADMGPGEVQAHRPLDKDGRALMKAEMQQMHLSAGD